LDSAAFVGIKKALLGGDSIGDHLLPLPYDDADFAACVLLTLCASAIFATSSDVFTSGPPQE